MPANGTLVASSNAQKAEVWTREEELCLDVIGQRLSATLPPVPTDVKVSDMVHTQQIVSTSAHAGKSVSKVTLS